MQDMTTSMPYMYDHKVVIHEHKSVQCNTSNCEQHTESKPAQLTGEELSTECEHARMSRLPLVTTCSFHASREKNGKEKPQEFHIGNFLSYLERKELLDSLPNHTFRSAFQAHLS